MLRISKDRVVIRRLLWNTWSSGDERILDKRQELSVGVFLRQGAAMRWAQRILELSKNFLGYQVIIGANGNKGMNDKCKQLPIRIYRWSGISKVVVTKSRENIGEYLWNLLVQHASICNKGNSRWMWSRDTNVRATKTILTRIEERSESQSIDVE